MPLGRVDSTRGDLGHGVTKCDHGSATEDQRHGLEDVGHPLVVILRQDCTDLRHDGEDRGIANAAFFNPRTGIGAIVLTNAMDPGWTQTYAVGDLDYHLMSWFE